MLGGRLGGEWNRHAKCARGWGGGVGRAMDIAKKVLMLCMRALCMAERVGVLGMMCEWEASSMGLSAPAWGGGGGGGE